MKTKDKKKLDVLWAKKLKEKNNTCEIPGCTREGNAHHFIGRRNLALRWYLPNGVIACPLHHVFGTQSAHQDPDWFNEIIKSKRGQEWHKDLRQKSFLTFKGTFQKVKDYLEGGNYYI